MAINTSGFQTSVLPQVPQVDPSLFAFDPQKLTTGVVQGLDVASTMDKLKSERAHQQELRDTRDARIAQIKALSDLDVLSSERQKALQAGQIESENLANKGKSLQGQDFVNKFGDITALNDSKRKLEQLTVNDATTDFEKDKALRDRVKAAGARQEEAHATLYEAQANKALAEAAAKGKPATPEETAFLKKLGGNAADLMIDPAKILDLMRSGAVNEQGMSLAVELGKFAADVQKPEFGKNPFSTISEGLKRWLAGSPEAIHVIERKLNAVNQSPQPSNSTPGGLSSATGLPPAGGDMGGAGVMAPATQGQPAAPAAPAQGVPTIRYTPEGRVERIGAERQSQPAANPTAQPQADNGDGSLAGNLADLAAVVGPLLTGAKGAAKSVAGSPATANAKLAALRLLAKAGGREALKNLAVNTSRVVGGAVAPASVAYGLNNIAGKAMSKSMLGNLQPVVGDRPQNLGEALVLGTNQPSTESMAAETRYDDVSHRIQSLMRNYHPDDPKIVSDLTKLLNERNLLWSMIQSGKYGEDFASRNQ